jgi:hypothetical protein
MLTDTEMFETVEISNNLHFTKLCQQMLQPEQAQEL